MIIIHISSRFERSFKKLPNEIKANFFEKLEIFKNNPFEKSLKTHKLNGNLREYYAFYLKNGYRVLVDFKTSNNILLVNIGSHDDYKKWGA